MKIFLAILLIYPSLVLSQDISLELIHKQSLYDQLLKPVWENLNYEIPLVLEDEDSQRLDIRIELIDSSLILGKKAQPLFQMLPHKENHVLFKWKLQNLKSQLLLKVRFIYTKFGATLTHDERFKVDIKGIKNGAESLIKLLYINPKLDFKIIKNTSLSINELKVVPKDGLGSTLKWIFDNVFSEKEVNDYIKDQLNLAINKSLSQDHIQKQIETAIKNEIVKISDQPLKISPLASQVKISPEIFKIKDKTLLTQAKTVVSPLTPVPHFCTQNLFQKNRSQVSYNLIEDLLKNILIYERVQNEQYFQPLLCLGYQDYSSQGSPLGLPLQTKILGRKVDFKLWMKPLNKPQFKYSPEQSLVYTALKMAIVIKSSKIPSIDSGNTPIEFSLNLALRPEFIAGYGLKMKLHQFQLESIKGNIILKYAKLLPKFKISLTWIRSILEKTISQYLDQQLNHLILMNHQVPFYGSTITIKNISMTTNGYQIEFDLL